ncbi:hypothetical protein DL96DRAFT_875293 [Flagelloscypha sp. PMI_526]|nr:hypothetical protein DL96DRAFT_875293 [Flagelloscypha sp. PMI_526]
MAMPSNLDSIAQECQQGENPHALDPNARLFGIPRFQPFAGGRSFNYEQKYPEDPFGEEARDEARV